MSPAAPYEQHSSEEAPPPEVNVDPGGRGAPALRLSGITKRFGALVANDEVTLDVDRGDIHALLGENGAGKSTLMRVASGFMEPDEGGVELDGEAVSFRKPEQALRSGIGMVHQHFTLVPTLTAVENVAMRPAMVPRRTDLAAVEEEVRRLCEELGFSLEPTRLVSEMSVAERQRLEIIKLIYRGADVLIFDEPSAALSPPEWTELAKLLRGLAGSGKAIILITHKIDEVMSVASHYTVLREGSKVGEGRIASVQRDELVKQMVGTAIALTSRRDDDQSPPGDPTLEVRGLSVSAEGEAREAHESLHDVTFEVRSREILGVAGVAGSGQDELIETILGLRGSSGGTMTLDGEPFDERSPEAFYRRGGAYIAEDRHSSAIADELSIWENILMREAIRPPIASRGLIQKKRAHDRARELMEVFDVRAPNLKTPIEQLSGGNQQKVVLARELAGDPRLILAVQPSRGLDVKATQFVHQQLLARRQAGSAVMLFSFDLDELLALSDRVAVLSAGRVQGILDADEADPVSIGRLMVRSMEEG